MPQIVTITAATKEMKANKEKPVEKDVTFPTTLDEIRAGIGPWKSVAEMFRDAVKHRVVIIQSDMRRALESGEDVENGRGRDIEFED